MIGSVNTAHQPQQTILKTMVGSAHPTLKV